MSVAKEIGSDGSIRWLSRLVAVLSLASLIACATNDLPPLEALDRKVDLERFMGDWCVVGFTPVSFSGGRRKNRLLQSQLLRYRGQVWILDPDRLDREGS
jgi:lipocalin